MLIREPMKIQIPLTLVLMHAHYGQQEAQAASTPNILHARVRKGGGTSSSRAPIRRAEEDAGDAEHADDGQHLRSAAQLSPDQQHLGQWRVQWELHHLLAQVRQSACTAMSPLLPLHAGSVDLKTSCSNVIS